MNKIAQAVCRWLIGTVPGTKKKQEAEIESHKRKIKVNTDRVNKTVHANLVSKLF